MRLADFRFGEKGGCKANASQSVELEISLQLSQFSIKNPDRLQSHEAKRLRAKRTCNYLFGVTMFLRVKMLQRRAMIVFIGGTIGVFAFISGASAQTPAEKIVEAVTSSTGQSLNAEEPKADASTKIPDNFKTENLIVWCIVPFDAKNRGPVDRATMVNRMGLKRVGYDWRKKHIPEFEQEILEYKKNDLEYFAFWGWHESMEALVKKHEISPQVWDMHRGQLPSDATDVEKTVLVAEKFLPIAKTAKSLGLKFGIYNHGGWAGEPKNLVAVCELLRTKYELDNVGIVYNFHHGHGDIEDFESKFNLVKPYLLCVNINGMADADKVSPKTHENKILPIGTGTHEAKMIGVVIDSGYAGPIGVLGHRAEMDAEKSVGLNLTGLQKLLMER